MTARRWHHESDEIGTLKAAIQQFRGLGSMGLGSKDLGSKGLGFRV